MVKWIKLKHHSFWQSGSPYPYAAAREVFLFSAVNGQGQLFLCAEDAPKQ